MGVSGMKISMIPSNDVKTIHASQDDTQREWCFEPFDNSGTLIIGEESLANIERIKGNTLAFNQLVNNGNFADTSAWNKPNVTFSVSNNVGTMVASARYGNLSQNLTGIPSGHKCIAIATIKSYTNSATKFLFRTVLDGSVRTAREAILSTTEQTYTLELTTDTNSYVQYVIEDQNTSGWGNITVKNAMVFDLTRMFGSGNEPTLEQFRALFPLSYYSNQSTLLPFKGTSIKTVGKNQFDPSAITPNIATVTISGNTVHCTYGGGTTRYLGFHWYNNPLFTDVFLKGIYRLSFDVSGLDVQWTIGLRKGATFVGGQTAVISADGHYSRTLNTEENPECYLSFSRTGNSTGAFDITFSNIQLELGTTETEYTPYVESTTDLPTLTYFPTGMKSAGNVYDELLPNKAITRVGMVDLGTLNYTRTTTQTSGVYRFIGSGLPSDVKLPANNGIVANMSSIYTSETVDRVYNGIAPNMSVSLSAQGTFHIRNDSYTTAEAFKSAMSGIYLYYELATETETDVNADVFYPVYQYGTEQILPINGTNPTTAPFVGDIYYADGLKTDQTFLYRQTPINYNTRQFALVSKNTQTPLTLKDGKGYCNSPLALTNESGFFDAKLKMTDSDGVCYSEKFQIHVERKP